MGEYLKELDLSQYAILHFAPEKCVENLIYKKIFKSYKKVDLHPVDNQEFCNIENIQFSDEQFDIIICSHVLEHVDDPVQTLALLARWVEPQSGHVVITVPNAESIHRRVGVAMGLHSELDDLSARDLTVGHQRVYSLGSLTQTLELAGWGISEVQGFFLKPLSNAQLVESGDEAIRALCEVSLELPPEICANLTVIARPRSADTFVDSA